VGSIIDAHPHATIAHEYHALQRFLAGTPRLKILTDILWLSRESAKIGRPSQRVEGGVYFHRIRNGTRDIAGGLTVIGDKKGAGSVVECQNHGIDTLAHFSNYIKLPLRIIHVIRNPFDMVAAAVMGGESAQHYSFFNLVPIVAQLRKQYVQQWLDLYYEDLIARPETQIRMLLSFLGLPEDQKFMRHATRYLFTSPHTRRDQICWTSELRDRVIAAIREHDFLRRYEGSI
jgi:hypothetical protein